MVGGGIGDARWVLNMTVDRDYGRLDPAEHLMEVAEHLALEGRGIGMMTAVDVRNAQSGVCEGVSATATVGARQPTWAADVGPAETTPGTINIIVSVPVRLGDAALVNAVATATEAKVQAFIDCDIAGTGTATDAVCVLCSIDGESELFGGPRSLWGSRIAQATYHAVVRGIEAQRGA